MTNLSTISADLQEGKGSAGKLLKDPALYNDVDHLMIESRDLISAVRARPEEVSRPSS